MSDNKLKLTSTQQQVYDFLYEQISVHGNISISRTLLSDILNISLMSIRRATDFIINTNLKPYGLQNIYAGYIGNFLYYSFYEIPDDVSEVDVHIIQSYPKQMKIFEKEQDF